MIYSNVTGTTAKEFAVGAGKPQEKKIIATDTDIQLTNNNGQLTNAGVADPILDSHATNKGYADKHYASKDQGAKADTALQDIKIGSVTIATADPTINAQTKDNVTILNFSIPKGEKGDPGKDGKTPVKGEDYNTPQDKKEMMENVYVFNATFLSNGWKQSANNTWTQTVSCLGMKASYDTSAPWIYRTGDAAADKALREALAILCNGEIETLDGQLRATIYSVPPHCNVQLYVRRAVMSAGGNGGSTVAPDGSVAVVQEYKQGDWRVRVWSSGLKECWFYGKITFTGDPIGSGVPDIKLKACDVPLPIRYIKPPCAVASCNWAWSEWLQATPSTDKIGLRMFAVSAKSIALQSIYASIYVSGE